MSIDLFCGLCCGVLAGILNSCSYVIMIIGDEMFRFERNIVDSRAVVIAPAGPDREELVLQKVGTTRLQISLM